MSAFNDPKKSVRLYKQDGEIWFEYFGGEDKVLINPRIAEMLNSRLGVEYIDFDEIPPEDIQERRMQWSSVEQTVGIGMPGGKVTLNVGQEMFIPRRVENKTGANLKNGELIYISGGTGVNAHVSLAKADALTTSSSTIAMLTEDIDDNAKGYATAFGIVRGDTDQPIDTSSYAVGTELYLSSATAGGFTDTKPAHPNYCIRIGQVFRQHAAEGEILVHIEDAITADRIAGAESAVWIDENFDSVSTARGASAPDLITYKDTNILVAALDGASTSEELNSWREYQHNAVQGDADTTAVVDFHAHVGPTTANTGDVKLSIEVYISRIDGGELYSQTIDGTQSDIADGTAWEDRIFRFPDINLTTIGIGTQIGARLYRNPSDPADTYGDDIFIKTWGYHFKVDSAGSREKTSKG